MKKETMRFELCPDVEARAIGDVLINVFQKKKVTVMSVPIKFLDVMITIMCVPFDRLECLTHKTLVHPYTIVMQR
jgi:hypothetical protein